jgi:hypothetical protein
VLLFPFIVIEPELVELLKILQLARLMVRPFGLPTVVMAVPVAASASMQSPLLGRTATARPQMFLALLESAMWDKSGVCGCVTTTSTAFAPV